MNEKFKEYLSNECGKESLIFWKGFIEGILAEQNYNETHPK